jgi:hypothetical protein
MILKEALVMGISLRLQLGCSRIGRLVVMLVLVALVVGAARPAVAQGTEGMLPEPISTHELKGYGDRLKLSAQQRQAADAIHDQYKRDFRALRQGEIAEFLKDMRAIQGSVMPRRDVMESFMKRMDLLNGRIATLDSRLFDQLQAILTDEQMAMMPRARMARQRARYAANQMMWMTGNRAVDLSEIVMGMDLSADQKQILDSTLSGYEGRLTSSMAKLYDATSNMIIKMFDAMEEMGFVEQDLAEPENMQKFGEAMQQIWKDLMAQAVEASGVIAELNRRTYRSLASSLPEDKSRELRNAYYGRAYPEAGFALSDETARFSEALKIEDLTPEQRDALAAARTDLQQKLDHMVEDVVKLIDDQRNDFSPFDFNSEKMQEHARKMKDYQTRVTEARTSSIELLTSLIGEEAAKKVEKAAMAQAAAPGGLSAAMRAAMEKAEAVRAESADAEANQYLDDATAIQQAWTGDQFVAPPISRSDVKRYAEILNIPEGERALLTQLHATYLENFKKVQENEIAELTKAVQSMWKFDIETQTTTAPSSTSLEATEKARRDAIDAVSRADDLFFNDVQIALMDNRPPAALERVRLMRQRGRWNRGIEHMWAFAGRVEENRIDLSSFMHKQPLSDNDRAARDEDLIAYEQAATPAFRDRFEAALAMQHAQDLWQIEMQQARSDGENNQFKVAARYQEMLGEPSKRVGEASAAIVKLNRQWLDTIIAKLPPDSAHAVRRAYNRAAFPSVYNDPLALELQLTEAAKLPDLGPEQLRRVNEVAGEFRPAYTNLCEQMAEISGSGTAPSFAMGTDSEAWKQWQERREALASLRFDRNELCLRTINQLKAILSEDQVQRIGGFPEPQKRQPYEDWME